MKFSRVSFGLVTLAILVMSGVGQAEGDLRLSVSKSFVEGLDVAAIQLVAVQEDGRVKTFDSLAREKLKHVVGSKLARAQEPVVVYLDMMLNPEQYRDANIIFVKKPAMRRDIIEGVKSLTPPQARQGVISGVELNRFEETGFVSLNFIDHNVVRTALSELRRDLMRSNKAVGEIMRARNIADPRFLHAMLKVIPPPGMTDVDPWYPIAQLFGSQGVTQGGSGHDHGEIPGVSEELSRKILASWSGLQTAWANEDVTLASTSLNELAAIFPTIEPDLYPSPGRLSLEHWYYKSVKMTWVWILYFLALPLLLMAVVYKFKWARIAGLGFFSIGFAAHTASIIIRWVLAERIPNANMFEAVVASAWFGGVIAIVYEIICRKKALKNMGAMCASAYAMVAMMVGYYSPVSLNSDITTVMPVLDKTIWLYIHTNIVIGSYGLIFFGGVTALFYLCGSGINLFRGEKKGRTWDGRSGLSKSFDGATMVFLQLAFITLWVGTALGAVWADVSWGRPWGWDPKEVFALNTWIVLLILVHVRLKVRNKGFWTAIIALIACGVMLFNWIIVNFVVVGLHSYA